MNVLALCAGVGGLELGVRLANPSARCVCYVEGEAYAVSTLIGSMASKIMDEAPIWSDVRTFDGKPWRGKVDCITGGYPCQPISISGHKLGDRDPRYLWPHFRRIIEEVAPTRCFFENVSNHLRIGYEQVHDDLRAMGYRVACGLFTAEEVGESHQRERLFIMADAVGRSGERPRSDSRDGQEKALDRQSDRGGGDIPLWPPGRHDIAAWRADYPLPVESTLPGMANGATDRADQLRLSGNAVSPLVAAYAWRVLEDYLFGPVQIKQEQLLLF